jgi:hypothetical protein
MADVDGSTGIWMTIIILPFFAKVQLMQTVAMWVTEQIAVSIEASVQCSCH